jgi:hypothetical protein
MIDETVVNSELAPTDFLNTCNPQNATRSSVRPSEQRYVKSNG